MDDHIVATVDKLDDGEHLIVELKGREIAVFNVNGEYFAYPNWCPHQGGPLCEGKVSGTTDITFDRETLESDLIWAKDGEIVTCPWHSWEFDLTENQFLHDRKRRLPSYCVRVEDDDIIVSV